MSSDVDLNETVQIVEPTMLNLTIWDVSSDSMRITCPRTCENLGPRAYYSDKTTQKQKKKTASSRVENIIRREMEDKQLQCDDRETVMRKSYFWWGKTTEEEGRTQFNLKTLLLITDNMDNIKVFFLINGTNFPKVMLIKSYHKHLVTTPKFSTIIQHSHWYWKGNVT